MTTGIVLIRMGGVLQGRAYLEARIKLKEKRYNNVGGGVMKIVADGYNAPVTAGAFVDLVEKKFYDNMEIQRADGLVVQTGRPEGEVKHSLALHYCCYCICWSFAADSTVACALFATQQCSIMS